ncbi:MAG: acetolactate synthase large subunit [Myxococcota bacterium]
MNGARAVLETALRGGSRICFANPGTTEMPLVAALDALPEVRAVLGLFEGVCTGAADGWARMRGEPALALLHLGPGLGNGIANLHNARRAYSPVVNLVGDHATWHIANDPPLASDIESLARPVSRFVRTSRDAASLARDTADAMRAALEGERGVATLVLPADLQAAEGCAPAPVSLPASPAPARDAVERAARALREAARPLVLLGGRALRADALAQAARIATACGARLVSEVFPAHHERGRGRPPVERLPYFPEQAAGLLAEHDAVVLAGATAPVAFFGYAGMPGRLTDDARTHVAFGPAEDARAALEALADALDAPARGAFADASLPPHAAPGTAPLTPGSLGVALARALPENAIVVDEGATSSLGFGLASQGAAPHSMLSLTGGAIGQGLPCAVGAALACPDRPVVAIQADGSAAYTLQALWTAARESLDVVVVLCSNRAYRILQIELARAGVAEPGPKARALTNLDAPPLDWAALARGFGLPAAHVRRVETPDALRDGLAAAFAARGPHLLEAVL